MDHSHHHHDHSGGAPDVIRDPVCGMMVDMATNQHKHTHEGRELGFCCGGCKTKFIADPDTYLSATDPVCGMSVDKPTAKWMSKHEGQKVYFCCEGCQTKFEADPAKYPLDKPAFSLPPMPAMPAAKGGEVIRDPVCGMMVDMATNQHKHTHEGRELGFCCEGCKTKFIADPDAYLSATDPVCGMSVDKPTAKWMSKHEGQKVYFCCEGCQTKFEADPDKFLSGAPVNEAPPVVPAGTKWTCPMDPEIIRDEFGDCPICGMALEPMGPVSADQGPNPELVDFTRRFWVSLIFSIPLLIISMGPMIGLPIRDWIGERVAGFLELALAAPVVLWAAQPFFRRGWNSIINRSPNMWTLIALGTGVAFLFSLVSLLVPGILPEQFAGGEAGPPLYFEASAVIITLVFVGQILELRARDQTGSALRALLDLSPKTAIQIWEGKDHEVSLDKVKAGDHLRVKAGQAVPVDGFVVSGESYVDESMLTGESAPQHKVAGDGVTGGTINGDGTLVVEARAVGSETRLNRIVELVTKAQRSRAPIQALADRVSAWFVPTVVAVSILSFVSWMVFGPEPKLAFAIVTAVSVLVIACPCALGLATPMSVMVATGRGARAGVLVKDAKQLEVLAGVDTIIVDKTGTLTEGKPQVTHVLVTDGEDENEVLRHACRLERHSTHPIGKAILQFAEVRGLKVENDVGNFASVSGQGLAGTYDGDKVMIGTLAFLEREGADVSGSVAEQASRLEAAGESLSFVARADKVIGAIAVSDPIRKGAGDAISYLRENGVRVVMATGDGEGAAQKVATALKLDDVNAKMSPEAKHDLVMRLKREGRKVAVCGDGVNDGPALAAADVGIAMGSGSDVAIESAGITLLEGDISAVVRAHKLAKGMLGNVRQNLFFAFAYNTIGVPIAAGILYPVFGLLLSPMIAAAAMSLSSVSVITNALRLRGIRL